MNMMPVFRSFTNKMPQCFLKSQYVILSLSRNWDFFAAIFSFITFVYYFLGSSNIQLFRVCRKFNDIFRFSPAQFTMRIPPFILQGVSKCHVNKFLFSICPPLLKSCNPCNSSFKIFKSICCISWCTVVKWKYRLYAIMELSSVHCLAEIYCFAEHQNGIFWPFTKNIL